MSTSSLNDSENNKRGSAEPATQDIIVRRPQDEKYYYSDGSAVFLVEGVLFKLHATLIFGSNRDVVPVYAPDYDGYHQVYPMYIEDLPTSRLVNSSDSNPIELPNITISQFRHFLLAVLGLPHDEDYADLMSNFRERGKHTQDLLIQYLDIACLARRFGRPKLETWAQNAVRPVLVDSKWRLALGKWDKDTLLRLRSYAYSTRLLRLISPMTTFIEYLASVSADESPTAVEDEISSFNLNTCAKLFTDPDLPRDDSILFGCVFVCILSLGHRSSTWNTKLTGKDRARLYAAQVQLTRISSELDNLNWLLLPVTRNTLSSLYTICEYCQQRFKALWNETFGQCGDLTSSIPLKDISQLARLPQYRQSIVDNWEDYMINLQSAREPSSSWLTRVGSAFACSRSGCTLDHLLANVDDRIQSLYEELAGQYHRFADEV